MANLTINGIEKLKNIEIGDWICTDVDSDDKTYLFIFAHKTVNVPLNTVYIYNIIKINRIYEGDIGYKISVDFIVNDNRYKDVNTEWIYSHHLITMDTFKDILEKMLKIYGK